MTCRQAISDMSHMGPMQSYLVLKSITSTPHHQPCGAELYLLNGGQQPGNPYYLQALNSERGNDFAPFYECFDLIQ